MKLDGHEVDLENVVVAVDGSRIWRNGIEFRPRSEEAEKCSFYDEMRAAANVMDAVNARYRNEHPTAGNSPNEPISARSMRFLADRWEVVA